MGCDYIIGSVVSDIQNITNHSYNNAVPHPRKLDSLIHLLNVIMKIYLLDTAVIDKMWHKLTIISVKAIAGAVHNDNRVHPGGLFFSLHVILSSQVMC
jgi:hypothetical protein